MLMEGSYEARIAGVLRRHLEARFQWVSFDAIMVVLRTNQWDENSIHVYVVHEENGETLDLRWLSGVRNRMRRELRDLGPDLMVTTSYIDRSELELLLDLIASPEAADESRGLLTPEMESPISLGVCNLCKEMVNDPDASGHLIECIARQDLPRASGSSPPGYDQSLHLSVHDGSGLYWMQLAVRADTTLRQLDGFLRGMWLERCGHLSEFKIQGTRYSNLAPHPDDPDADVIRADYWMEDDEVHMDVAVADVMPEGVEVSYEYDYGSTTELYLKNLGRHGDLVGLLRPRQPWHGDRVVVLACNEPDEECVACRDRRAGSCFLRTLRLGNSYPSATSAVPRPGATGW